MHVELSSKRQINHKVMRIIIGIIALLLSPVVWLLSGIGFELTSISFSYWTDSHDIFVGSMIVVGFFLSAYNGMGSGRDWEYRLSKLACVFAICVGIFPTKGYPDVDVPAKWVEATSAFIGLTPEIIHAGAAVLLFTCLIALMWFFSVRAMKKGKPYRAYLYRGVSLLMAIGIIGLTLVGKLTHWETYLFWVELWGLTLFGLGWLVAGSYKSE